MTVYHVWKPGQDEPEVVEADGVGETAGHLIFHHALASRFPSLRRRFLPHEWSRWSVVPDDAGEP